MRPKLKAVVMPDCDKRMKSCDKCEHFDAARRTQSCQAHEHYSYAEIIAALLDALKELTGKDYAEVCVGEDKKPPKEAEQ